MAPKASKAKGKAKAAAAEPVDLEEPLARDVRRRIKGKGAEDQLVAAMPKAEISGMLGYLKYHADPAKEKNPELLDASSKALAAYAACDKHKKPDFLAKFKCNKKDLSWVNAFEEETTKVQETHDVVKEGRFYGNFILKEMGFEPSSTLPHLNGSRLAKIIKESEDYFGYKVKVDKDDEDAEMDKYHFKFIPTTTHRTGTSESSRLSAAADVTKALKEASPPPKIKLENPVFVEVCNEARILKSGKCALEKKLAIMLDKIACLKMDNQKNDKPAICDRGARWQAAADNVDRAISCCRDAIYQANLLTVSSDKDDCASQLRQVKDTIQEVKAHDEAVKIMLSEMKSIKSI